MSFLLTGLLQGRIQGEGCAVRASPKIGKNMIFWCKIVIFHTKYSKNVRVSLCNWRKYDFFWRKIVMFHTKYSVLLCKYKCVLLLKNGKWLREHEDVNKCVLLCKYEKWLNNDFIWGGHKIRIPASFSSTELSCWTEICFCLWAESTRIIFKINK
jgi:hypothetical protein